MKGELLSYIRADFNLKDGENNGDRTLKKSKKIWIISKLVEGQITGLSIMPSDFRGPEGKLSCLQS
jgi:hypothetical protein